MNNIEICSRLFIAWNLSKSDQELFNPEYEKVSFIAKVLRKKMEVFKINVKIPDHLIMIIETCTESNPGISQLMLKEILDYAKSKGKFNPDKEYMITPDDFAFTYPEFPIINITPPDEEGTPLFMRTQRVTSKWEDYFHKAWDHQKDENGQNKCDTPEWWSGHNE